ncbi:MAG: mechanosensitive ion channel [Bacteroidota bacterium]
MNLAKQLEQSLASIGNFLPGILGALLVLIIGWLISRVISRLAGRLVRNSNLQKRIGQASESRIASSVQKLVYYILMVIVLLAVLEIMGIENVLVPLENMLSEFLGFVPNIVGAFIAGFAGYVLASIASELVGLASDGVETFGAKMGIRGEIDFTNIIKQVIFLIVFIPLLIAAFDILNIDTISDPAKMMLNELVSAIPNIIAAVLIIAVFFFGGRYVTSILESLLVNLGVDNMSQQLGLSAIIGRNQSLAGMVSNIAFFFIIFSGIITGIEKLEFVRLSETLRDLFELSGQIFFGLIVLAIGNFVSVIASQAIQRSQGSAFLASVARVATMALFLAIALRMMGIANEIVELAFGLTLGAIAVAVALSFGLGGREAAGKQMEHILKKFRNE